MLAARRAIVEVRWGPLGRKRAVILAGTTLRVGRSNVLDLCFPQDAQMSAEHLTLAWDGERCRVRDLESAGGTWLGGERVAEADVPNGAWIRAGATNLMVYLEASTPPLRDAARAPADQVAAVLAALREVREPLYAVVDASRGKRPLQLLREAVDPSESLYEGVKGDALAHSAPYLVKLDAGSGLLERLLAEGWGARWAIFLASPRPFKEVRRHLRRFLIVEDDVTAEKYYFRFYDPRTLRVFLPTCTPRQTQELFDGVSAYYAEGTHGELCRYEG
jgi:pSer/pThr/pTyr-binding forkhead associated (FHA) protein